MVHLYCEFEDNKKYIIRYSKEENKSCDRKIIFNKIDKTIKIIVPSESAPNG